MTVILKSVFRVGLKQTTVDAPNGQTTIRDIDPRFVLADDEIEALGIIELEDDSLSIEYAHPYLEAVHVAAPKVAPEVADLQAKLDHEKLHHGYAIFELDKLRKETADFIKSVPPTKETV